MIIHICTRFAVACVCLCDTLKSTLLRIDNQPIKNMDDEAYESLRHEEKEQDRRDADELLELRGGDTI